MTGTRSSAFRMMTPFPPTGNPSASIDLGGAEPVERKAANGGVAAGKEALARRQLHAGLFACEPGRHAQPRAPGEDQPVRRRAAARKPCAVK